MEDRIAAVRNEFEEIKALTPKYQKAVNQYVSAVLTGDRVDGDVEICLDWPMHLRAMEVFGEMLEDPAMAGKPDVMEYNLKVLQKGLDYRVKKYGLDTSDQ
jgi:hypothetical protein